LLWELRKYCTKKGWRKLKNEWIAVVEAHRTGWPHVNFLIYCPELALALETERVRRLADGRSARESILVHGALQGALSRSGWGIQSTAEQVRDIGALGGYVTKLAGEQAQVSGELAKLTQAPTVAPHRFRRLRAGRGFLPAKRTNPETTGTLVRREWDPQRSAHGAVPLHDVAPDQVDMAALACALEGDQIEAECFAAAEGKPFVPLARTFAVSRSPSGGLRGLPLEDPRGSPLGNLRWSPMAESGGSA